MLIDALNFSNNVRVELSDEFIDSCRHTVGTTVIAPNLSMVWNENMKQIETTNFLLNIPFAPDNTNMEWLTRIGNDITWITDEQVSAAMFKGTRITITHH
jgi:tryptophan synthase alpha subunit